MVECIESSLDKMSSDKFFTTLTEALGFDNFYFTFGINDTIVLHLTRKDFNAVIYVTWQNSSLCSRSVAVDVLVDHNTSMSTASKAMVQSWMRLMQEHGSINLIVVGYKDSKMFAKTIAHNASSLESILIQVELHGKV